MNLLQPRSTARPGSPTPGRRRRSPFVVTAALLLAITALLAGCGGSSSNSGDSGSGTVKEYSPAGDIPDDQVFVDYTDTSGRVTIKVPEGWAQSDTANGVSFTGAAGNPSGNLRKPESLGRFINWSGSSNGSMCFLEVRLTASRALL